MLVHKVESYRYYSDFSGFDFVVVIESKHDLNLEVFLDDIITSWFEYPSEYEDTPLTDMILHELGRKNINASIYHCFDDGEEW